MTDYSRSNDYVIEQEIDNKFKQLDGLDWSLTTAANSAIGILTDIVNIQNIQIQRLKAVDNSLARGISERVSNVRY